MRFILAQVVAVAALVLLLLSWFKSLFGLLPLGPWIGPLGFVLAVLGLGSLARKLPESGSFARENAPFPSSRRVFLRISAVMVVCAVLSLLVLVFSSAQLGVANEKPVFQERTAYILTNHGQTTQVSRLRYCLSGASFVTGWHCLAGILALELLYRGCFRRSLYEDSQVGGRGGQE